MGLQLSLYSYEFDMITSSYHRKWSRGIWQTPPVKVIFLVMTEEPYELADLEKVNGELEYLNTLEFKSEPRKFLRKVNK